MNENKKKHVNTTAKYSALAAWLLQRELGIAFLVPIGLVLACFAITLILGKLGRKRQGIWMKGTKLEVRMYCTLSWMFLLHIPDL